MIQNPILRGFHPDPSIIRVGEGYYVAASAFEWSVSTKLRASRISRHYNHTSENAVLERSVQGTEFVSVFAVIALDKKDKEEPVVVEKLPVYSSFKRIQFTDKQIEALRIRKGSRSWVVAAAHEEYASPTDTFRAGGCTGFGGVVIFDEAAGETEIGAVLAR